MRRVGLVLAVVSLVTVLLAQPAVATFPGKNGRIAYTDAAFQIATMKPDGTGIKVLTSFAGGWAGTPQYSPNGRWIVFSADNGVQYDIYKMREDGTRLRQLTDDVNTDTHPSFSPDGKKIVYGRDAGWIWVMDANGANAHQIAVAPANFPRYSPNGKKILYANFGDNEIHVMKADGSSDHAITSNAFFDGGPDWSPDGKKIVFVSDRSASGQAWVMNADGSSPAQITTTGANGTPAFSPNGKRIVGNDNASGIFVVKLDGTGYRTLGSTSGCCLAWQPL